MLGHCIGHSTVNNVRLRPSFFLSSTDAVLLKHVGAYEDLQIQIVGAKKDQPIPLLCFPEMSFEVLIALTTFPVPIQG